MLEVATASYMDQCDAQPGLLIMKYPGRYQRAHIYI